jgi:hypothetical protein
MHRSHLLLVLALGGLAHSSPAQVFQPWGSLADRSVSLDLLRPSFDGGGTSTLTTINQLGFRWAVGKIVLVAEAPFVNAKLDGASSGALLIGNPFLGVATRASSSFIGEFGVRPPLASVSSPERAFASVVGLIGDFADFEAYAEDVLTIRATAGYHFLSPQHYGLRMALRPALMAPTGGGDTELFLDYAIQGGYETERASVGMVFSGRGLVTEPGLSIGERTTHELGLGGTMTFGRFRPAAIIRVPLDSDLSTALNYVLGLRLEYTF